MKFGGRHFYMPSAIKTWWGTPALEPHLCCEQFEAARHLYEDGDISREEYVKCKEQNEREITNWRTYTIQTQHLVSQMVMCVEAVGKLSQLWEDSSDEDRNRMAHHLFECVVYNLDQ